MKKIIKTTLFTLLLTAGILPLYAADGDVFAANTEEGVEMTFMVTSEEEKTCQVGKGRSAIDRSYAGKITIPMEAKGYKVTAIGISAFGGCRRLTSITIPESVTSIGEEAFYGCESLTSITIPESVTSIGNYAFFICTSLTSIDIPSSVTTIGESAFYGCSSLTSMTVASGNTVYDSRDNCNAIIETASNTLITGCMNTTIPSTITAIGESAFDGCTSLTDITIPEGVASIGNNAFCRCI